MPQQHTDMGLQVLGVGTGEEIDPIENHQRKEISIVSLYMHKTRNLVELYF